MWTILSSLALIALLASAFIPDHWWEKLLSRHEEPAPKSVRRMPWEN